MPTPSSNVAAWPRRATMSGASRCHGRPDGRDLPASAQLRPATAGQDRPRPRGRVIDDALELMAPRLRAVDARIDYNPPDPTLGHGRARAAAAGGREPDLQCARRDGRARVKEIGITVTEDGDGNGHLRDHRARPRTRPVGGRAEPGVRSVLHHQGPRQGLGLGLSISYNIIRDFDGTMSVAEPSRGRRGLHRDPAQGERPDAGLARECGLAAE
jgi:hypothetical protein